MILACLVSEMAYARTFVEASLAVGLRGSGYQETAQLKC